MLSNEEVDSSCNRESLTQWTDLSPFDTLAHYTEERVLLGKNAKSSADSALKVLICLSPPLLLHEAIVCWCCGADILVTISLVPTASLHAKILCNTHRNVRGTLLDHNLVKRNMFTSSAKNILSATQHGHWPRVLIYKFFFLQKWENLANKHTTDPFSCPSSLFPIIDSRHKCTGNYDLKPMATTMVIGLGSRGPQPIAEASEAGNLSTVVES